MQTNQLAEPGTKATLTHRVRRAPASLGGYHYFLEPGQVVYITGHAGSIPRYSTIADPSQRTSDDYFGVGYDGLKLEGTQELAQARAATVASRKPATQFGLGCADTYIPISTA